MTSIVELKDVTKRYGETTALDRVTLTVEGGEILSLLGPNGSGKTTLLRLMACLEEPDEGEIYFHGQPIDDPLEVRRHSTMVFQKAVAFTTTVYKNLAYGLRVRNYSDDEVKRRVRDVLRLVGLEGFEERYARHLSGGELQRLSLARALIIEPELLLLDEPTANLDPRSISVIEDAITKINREYGITIVIATHNLFQAEDMAKRTVILSRGKIVEMGFTEEVFRVPSRHLVSLARRENVFKGRAEILEGGISSIDIGEKVAVEVAGKVSGEVTLYISPQDIIVSKSHTSSSARNALEGEVKGVIDRGSSVNLRVDVGREFSVQITKQSFQEMNLNIGSHVFLIFKASSVQIIDR